MHIRNTQLNNPLFFIVISLFCLGYGLSHFNWNSEPARIENTTAIDEAVEDKRNLAAAGAAFKGDATITTHKQSSAFRVTVKTPLEPEETGLGAANRVLYEAVSIGEWNRESADKITRYLSLMTSEERAEWTQYFIQSLASGDIVIDDPALLIF